MGVGVNDVEILQRFARDGDFDVFMLAGRYTLLEQGALDEFLPLAVQKGIGVMLGGVIASRWSWRPCRTSPWACTSSG